MNIVVRTVLVSFELASKRCKILIDAHYNLLSEIITKKHKSVEGACRVSIESVLKTSADWMPVRFLFFDKDGLDLYIYYGVLVPEDIVIKDSNFLWTNINDITQKEEVDDHVKEAIWSAIRKIK